MYASIDDLKDRMKRYYAGLYADDDTGVVDDSLIIEDLTAASAEVDGAIANRYQTPVTAADALPLLKSWTLTLTEELAWSRGGSSELPENVTDRCKTVRQQLRRIGSGDFQLPATPAENTSAAGAAAVVSAAKPVFTRDQMTGF